MQQLLLASLVAILLPAFTTCARPLGAEVTVGADAEKGPQVLHPAPERRVPSGPKDQTSRPIIGILTQPGDVAEQKGQSYFSAGYVKWIEGAGARVVPVPYDLDTDGLDKMFRMLNGLLLPGGNYPLTTDTRWFRTAEYFIKRAVEAKKRGDHFPIHGTCLGFQLLLTFISRDQYALVPLDAHNHPDTVELTRAAYSSPWLSVVPDDVLRDLQDSPIAMHNHHYGLLPSALHEYPALGQFFEVLSYSHDRAGIRYVSMIEAKEYPFTGIAFHPEKVLFEWTREIDIPHTREASNMAYALAQAFVSQARKNNHRGPSIVDEDKAMIYNFQPLFFGKRHTENEDYSFEQVYLFEDGDWRKWMPLSDA